MALPLHPTVWVCVAPPILIHLILVWLVLLQHRNILRSLDLHFLALITCFILQVSLAVIVLAASLLQENTWSEIVCEIYTWLTSWLRIVEIFVLVAISVDRVLILHARFKYRGSPSLLVIIMCLWLAAAFLSAIPVIGWQGLVLRSGTAISACYFLPFEFDLHYSLFIIILQITSLFLSIGCLADVWCHLNFVNSRKSTPFTVNPTSNSTASTNKGSAMGTRVSLAYAQAYESCRLVCIILTLTYITHHLPYAVLSFYVIFSSSGSSEDFRLVVMYLVLAEAFVVPLCLWMFNKRYRKSLSHFVDAVMGKETFFYPGRPSHEIFLESYMLDGLPHTELVTVPASVTVQQVITRNNANYTQAKNNPSYESDEEDDSNDMTQKSRSNWTRSKITSDSSMKEGYSLNTMDSNRSWVLVDGYLSRQKSLDSDFKRDMETERVSTWESAVRLERSPTEAPYKYNLQNDSYSKAGTSHGEGASYSSNHVNIMSDSMSNFSEESTTSIGVSPLVPFQTYSSVSTSPEQRSSHASPVLSDNLLVEMQSISKPRSTNTSSRSSNSITTIVEVAAPAMPSPDGSVREERLKSTRASYKPSLVSQSNTTLSASSHSTFAGSLATSDVGGSRLSTSSSPITALPAETMTDSSTNEIPPSIDTVDRMSQEQDENESNDKTLESQSTIEPPSFIALTPLEGGEDRNEGMYATAYLDLQTDVVEDNAPDDNVKSTTNQLNSLLSVSIADEVGNGYNASQTSPSVQSSYAERIISESSSQAPISPTSNSEYADVINNESPRSITDRTFEAFSDLEASTSSIQSGVDVETTPISPASSLHTELAEPNQRVDFHPSQSPQPTTTISTIDRDELRSPDSLASPRLWKQNGVATSDQFFNGHITSDRESYLSGTNTSTASGEYGEHEETYIHLQTDTIEEHAFPDPQTKEHAFPDPQTKEHIFPDPQTKEHAFHDPQTKEHAFPDPQKKEHAFPDPQTKEHAFPDPQTKNQASDVLLIPDTVNHPTIKATDAHISNKTPEYAASDSLVHTAFKSIEITNVKVNSVTHDQQDIEELESHNGTSSAAMTQSMEWPQPIRNSSYDMTSLSQRSTTSAATESLTDDDSAMYGEYSVNLVSSRSTTPNDQTLVVLRESRSKMPTGQSEVANIQPLTPAIANLTRPHYTESGYRNMEEGLFSRGRGRVIGTFPALPERRPSQKTHSIMTNNA